MTGFSSGQVDPSVVRRLKTGDRKAQEIVYRTFSSAVYTLARRVLRDEGIAEEVTQDTFIDVLGRADTLQDEKAFGGWIRTIAMNHCLMRLRSPWNKRREALLEDVRATASDAADRAIDIDQALDRLAPTARMVVWMHCVEGYTHDEIGEAFGKTASFSKSQLARAYDALSRDRFGDGEPGGEGDFAPKRGSAWRADDFSDTFAPLKMNGGVYAQ